MNILSQLIESKVVIIYRGQSPENCLKLSKMLMDTGIKFFEVTMNSPNSLEAIELLKNELGDKAHIGAGTVTSVEEVDAVANAGATYIISPNVNVDVINRTKELGLISIPGAFSPTEIELAWRSGADIVKVFPINVVGSEYIKQIRGPLDGIPLMPSGGITMDITEDLFQAGAAAIGIGVQLLGKEIVESMDSNKIKESAKLFLNAAGL